MTVAFVQMDMFLVQLKSHPLIITAHGFFLLDNAMTFTVNSDQFEIDKLQPRFDHQLSFFFSGINNTFGLFTYTDSIRIGQISKPKAK